MIKIVSGGQTGVDRAALEAAMTAGLQVGGWCPEGRLAEDGVIPREFPLRSLRGGSYRDRTVRNVSDSHGTLVVCSGPAAGGTLLTIETCKLEAKPFAVIDASVTSVSEGVRVIDELLRRFPQSPILNVAGPRKSEWPNGDTYVRELLTLFFSDRIEQLG